MEQIQYNSGNYNKYTSKNPLKRWMIKRLNRKILNLVQENVNRNLGGAVGLRFWMQAAEKGSLQI